MDEKEKLFLEHIEGFHWKYDLEKAPESLYVFKSEKCLFEIYADSGEINHKKIIISYRLGIKQQIDNIDFWFNPDIWDEFEKKFHMDFSECRSFFREMVQEHFQIYSKTATHNAEKDNEIKKIENIFA